MKTPLHIRELNRAREWYNPLRGLDIQRVVSLLEEAERGKYDDLQKLNRMSEKRHPTLRALKHRRLGALKKLDWDIKIPSTLPRGVTAAQAKAQQVFLRERYEAIENLPQAVEHLALATFRGFSHLEFHHEDNDARLPIVRLQPVPQWHFLRDPQEFDLWRYDVEARGQEFSSVLIEPENFIIRVVDDPLCEIALLCFIRRNLGKKNWTVFQEDYALTTLIATLGENTPLDKVKEWLELVKKVTGNSRMALPPGSEVKGLDLGNLDGIQFDNYIKAEDSDLVLAGTSGKLTMLTSSTGMNSDQGDVHEATFNELAVAEAAEITALFQAQHDKPLLRREFPSQPPVAYFELAAKDEEDVDALVERGSKLAVAGFDLDAAEMSEKTGLKLTRKAAPVQIPGQVLETDAGADPLKNRHQAALDAAREDRFLSAAERRLTAADRATMAPLLDLVRPVREEAVRLAALDDESAFRSGLEALQPRLRALQAALPHLEDAVLHANPALDEAFTEIYATALASGWIEHAQAQKQARPTAAFKGPGAKMAPSTRGTAPEAT